MVPGRNDPHRCHTGWIRFGTWFEIEKTHPVWGAFLCSVGYFYQHQSAGRSKGSGLFAILGRQHGGDLSRQQPMGANFGVLPELRDRPRDKRERAAAYAARALASLDKFLQENHIGDNYENHC